jgi:hypothetical protein
MLLGVGLISGQLFQSGKRGRDGTWRCLSERYPENVGRQPKVVADSAL